MKQEILNSKTLWREFYSTIDIPYTVLDDREENGAIIRRVRFKGRALHGERVDIYAVYMFSSDAVKAASSPSILLLGDCDEGVNEELMRIFFDWGYNVLMPDYGGRKAFSSDFTVYPDVLSFANYDGKGDSLYSAPNGAKNTCWFEWCGVARFAYEILKRGKLAEITDGEGKDGDEHAEGPTDNAIKNNVVRNKKIGAVGVKTGGEILLKILPFCDITCAATVNAFGWRSYKGINKFNPDGERLSKLSVDAAWLNYLAALDSQNYAPQINAPVLLLCTNHDEDVDMDRVYDTFSRLAAKEESSILYGVHHLGCVGRSGMADLTMFLSKYLNDREIYLPEVSRFEIKVDGDGDLVCVARFDERGEVEFYGVLCAEDSASAADREWALMPHKGKLPDGSEVYYINATSSASTVYVYVFERYTNGFTASSKIVSYNLNSHDYNNKIVKERVIYSSRFGSEGFYLGKREDLIVAKYFIKDFSKAFAEEAEGYGGIKGLLCDRGVITYRVGMTRYAPEEDSLLSFDLCSAKDCTVTFTLTVRSDGQKIAYIATFDVVGGRIWKKFLASATDFKCGKEELRSFTSAVSLLITSDEGAGAIINNMAWI